VREIRTLRVMWRELETGSRTSLAGHEGGNPGYRQAVFYRVTAPAIDPTTSRVVLLTIEGLTLLGSEAAINAAIKSVRDTFNKTIGWKLI